MGQGAARHVRAGGAERDPRQARSRIRDPSVQVRGRLCGLRGRGDAGEPGKPPGLRPVGRTPEDRFPGHLPSLVQPARRVGDRGREARQAEGRAGLARRRQAAHGGLLHAKGHRRSHRDRRSRGRRRARTRPRARLADDRRRRQVPRRRRALPVVHQSLHVDGGGDPEAHRASQATPARHGEALPRAHLAARSDHRTDRGQRERIPWRRAGGGRPHARVPPPLLPREAAAIPGDRRASDRHHQPRPVRSAARSGPAHQGRQAPGLQRREGGVHPDGRARGPAQPGDRRVQHQSARRAGRAAARPRLRKGAREQGRHERRRPRQLPARRHAGGLRSAAVAGRNQVAGAPLPLHQGGSRAARRPRAAGAPPHPARRCDGERGVPLRSPEHRQHPRVEPPHEALRHPGLRRRHLRRRAAPGHAQGSPGRGEGRGRRLQHRTRAARRPRPPHPGHPQHRPRRQGGCARAEGRTPRRAARPSRGRQHRPPPSTGDRGKGRRLHRQRPRRPNRLRPGRSSGRSHPRPRRGGPSRPSRRGRAERSRRRQGAQGSPPALR
ncbi:unannotated protein [freshwater metagenome]|uniref:Unannotated protein n=1 Tax=freshwater metagenome TaxID=449393 RepID=A0A6J7J427_9ZZZZ